MPTYEYACKKCGEHLEVVQSFRDDPLTKCPNCGAKQLRKVFGTIGITFKGSGFYKTDSRSGSHHREGRSESAKESVGSESKSDSKPESKSDSGSGSKPAAGSKSDGGSKSGGGTKTGGGSKSDGGSSSGARSAAS